MPISGLTSLGEERSHAALARLSQVVLGKWRLNRVLGVGGMAAVFEASRPNGSLAAIKILHADLLGNERARERFLAEGYAANRVSHPGVVTVRDEGTTTDGAVFLVMDLLRGQTIAERLKPGRQLFSVGEVLEIASQLLDVLVQAHDRGIVHRDIKPENVFVTQEGRVRLLDFGIARIDSSESSHAAEAGTTLGTPAFMPPEQALGCWAELDGRSDLWALGATMYLLLSGSPVREAGSITELLLGAMTRPVPSLGDVTALPRSVIAVVDRALAFDRDDRFPDARSMQLAVRAALDELSAPDSRATLPPASVEPMALSLRTPRPSSSTPLPLPERGPPRRGALPLFVALGFAVGIGIVAVARFGMSSSAPQATQPPPAATLVPVGSARVVVPRPAPSASGATSGAPAPEKPSRAQPSRLNVY